MMIRRARYLALPLMFVAITACAAQNPPAAAPKTELLSTASEALASSTETVSVSTSTDVSTELDTPSASSAVDISSPSVAPDDAEATATETVDIIPEPDIYVDLADLMSVTDLVVTVDVEGADADAAVRQEDPDDLPENKRGQGIVHEVVHARVTRNLLTGNSPSVGEIVRIKQEGGTIDGIRTIYPALTPLERDQSYLLFLRWEERQEVFWVAGIGQGRYPLGADGEPLPTGGDDPRSSLRKSLDTLTLDQIEVLVRSN